MNSRGDVPKAFTASPTLTDVQAAGFPMGGEPLAVDLADTLITATAEPIDLLTGERATAKFWKLHARELPRGARAPGVRATRELRDAIRNALDRAQQRLSADADAIAAINAASQNAPTSATIGWNADAFHRLEHEHAEEPQALALAAAARSAIDVLTGPALRGELRRCASPTCSMLFVLGDARRRWCTPNICGNRDRVARHYRQRREGRKADPSEGRP